MILRVKPMEELKIDQLYRSFFKPQYTTKEVTFPSSSQQSSSKIKLRAALLRMKLKRTQHTSLGYRCSQNRLYWPYKPVPFVDKNVVKLIYTYSCGINDVEEDPYNLFFKNLINLDKSYVIYGQLCMPFSSFY